MDAGAFGHFSEPVLKRLFMLAALVGFMGGVTVGVLAAAFLG